MANINDQLRDETAELVLSAINRLQEGIVSKEISLKECAYILKDSIQFVTPKLTANMTQLEHKSTVKNDLLSAEETEFLDS